MLAMEEVRRGVGDRTNRWLEICLVVLVLVYKLHNRLVLIDRLLEVRLGLVRSNEDRWW